jgi:hypothetical protein
MQQLKTQTSLQLSIEKLLFEYLSAISQNHRPSLPLPNCKQLSSFNVQLPVSSNPLLISNTAYNSKPTRDDIEDIDYPSQTGWTQATKSTTAVASPHPHSNSPLTPAKRRGRPSHLSATTQTSSLTAAEEQQIEDEEFAFSSLLYTTEPAIFQNSHASPAKTQQDQTRSDRGIDKLKKNQTASQTTATFPSPTAHFPTSSRLNPPSRLNKLSSSSSSHHLRIFLLISFILHNLNTNSLHLTTTLREMYYRNQLPFHTLYFPVQKTLNTVVTELATMLLVNREDLGIVSAAKGLIYGDLTIVISPPGIGGRQSTYLSTSISTRSSSPPFSLTHQPHHSQIYPAHHSTTAQGDRTPIIINCSVTPQLIAEHFSSSNPHSHINIPSLTSSTAPSSSTSSLPSIFYKSQAKYIIVCEKDGILQLLQQHYQYIAKHTENKGSFIIISGSGYPSLGVRRLVHRLSSQLQSMFMVLSRSVKSFTGDVG